MDKPCVVYRADCPMYQKEGDGMNREEAIKILENERDNHINVCNGVFYETRTEAIDMAIKALEQEPSGDLISREAVQDYIAKYLSQYLYNDVREAVEAIDEYIGELPSVNPQEPCIQEKQANADKIDAVYIDGFKAGYSQARFDLEQEPCSDAISRQAVLDGLASIAKAKAKSDAQKSLMGRVMFFTEHLPSVNPQEPKTGHWNEVFNDIEGEVRFYCSECNDYQMFTSRYCPNCGARMTENDRTCHTCKHYTSGENDGSCGSYICKGYSDWESDNCN